MRPLPHPSIEGIENYVPGQSKLPDVARVLKLSANENPRGPSPRALEAALRAMASPQRYPEGSAAELRAAVEEILGFPAEQIVCGAGSDDVLALAVRAYAGPGDEVLCSRHGFALYPVLARSAGALPVMTPEPEYVADVDALLSAVTPRTKALLLANPNNPTGTYLNAAQLQRLHAGLPPHVLLIVDGAYAEYADAPDFDDGSALIRTGAENVMLTRTFSKVYGLAALRVGYAYAPAPIAAVLHKTRGPFNVNAPGAAAAVAALRDVHYTHACLAENARERLALTDDLRALGLSVLPSQGNFVCVDFGDRVAKVDAALRAAGILVRGLTTYELPTRLRITVGTPEDNLLVKQVLSGCIIATS